MVNELLPIIFYVLAISILFGRSHLSSNSVFFARSGPPFIIVSVFIAMPRVTNGGSERARKQRLWAREGRSCKHRIITQK